jgi:hypothetical protein
MELIKPVALVLDLLLCILHQRIDRLGCGLKVDSVHISKAGEVCPRICFVPLCNECWEVFVYFVHFLVHQGDSGYTEKLGDVDSAMKKIKPPSQVQESPVFFSRHPPVCRAFPFPLLICN